MNNYNSRPQGQTNDRYKTSLCTNFSEQGNCSYGDRCRYAHGPEDLREPGSQSQQNFGGNGGGFMPQNGGNNYGQGRPQGVCRFFQQHNECKFGDNCRFSHEC